MNESTAANRAVVRLLVRSRDDFQAMRKRFDNRIGRKADGEAQNGERLTARVMREEDLAAFAAYADAARAQEQAIAKQLKAVLGRFPIYSAWLSSVKGIGEIGAGWIVGEFDILIATTVSKMWQFAGLNPGMVRGKKRIQATSYTDAMGDVIGSYADENGDVSELLVLTGELIPGDRLSSGFVAPFHKRLRTALCGVMADGFVKAQNSYCLDYYYPYKHRLEYSDELVWEIPARGKPAAQVAWKDAKKAHRDRAAKRYMVKMFLRDLYVQWRTIEGLAVRPPYQEEYLGHKHAQVA